MQTLVLTVLLVAAATGEWDFTFDVPEGFVVEQRDGTWGMRSPDAEHVVTLQRGRWPDTAALEQELATSALGCAPERPAKGIVACAYRTEVNGEKLPGYLVARVSKRGGGVAVNVLSSPTTPEGPAKRLALELLGSVKERSAKSAGNGAPKERKARATEVRSSDVGVKLQGGDRIALAPFAHFDVPPGFSGGRINAQSLLFAARDLAVTWMYVDGKPVDEVVRSLAAPRSMSGDTLERVSGPTRDGSVIRIGHEGARFAADTWVMDAGERGALVLVAFSAPGDSFRRGNATVVFMKGLRPVKGGAKPRPVAATERSAGTTTGAPKGKKDWTRELAGKVAIYQATSGGSSGGVNGIYVGTRTYEAYHFCSNGLVLFVNESFTAGAGNELSTSGGLRGRWQVRQDRGPALVMQFEDGSTQVKRLGNPSMGMLEQIPAMFQGTEREEEAKKAVELAQGLLGMTSPMFSNWLQLDLLPYETSDSPLCD